jgi:hypothetical protein
MLAIVATVTALALFAAERPDATAASSPTLAETALPSPSAIPTPAPTITHPGLVLRQDDIDAIAKRLAAGAAPQAAAWRVFKLRIADALEAAPRVYVGPRTTGGVGSTMEHYLDRDGCFARDLGLAYVLTKRTAYATKARDYLLAWAAGNRPTAFADCNDKWGGSYQAHGAFMLAYAYDLTYDSGVFSDAEKMAIEGYFRRFVDALDTYVAAARTEWVLDNPAYTKRYEWSAARRYRVLDSYLGGDNIQLTQLARLAMALVSHYDSVSAAIANDTEDVYGLQSMTRAALKPRNQGDGVAGHPVPVPAVLVYSRPVSGRGGTIDYMTYNARLSTVFYQVARNAHWDATPLAILKTRLTRTWRYLGRYFAPGAEAPFAPNDTVNLTACLPRFGLAYHTLGGRRLRAILKHGPRARYYETQLVGPVTLTHSIVDP